MNNRKSEGRKGEKQYISKDKLKMGDVSGKIKVIVSTNPYTEIYIPPRKSVTKEQLIERYKINKYR